MKNKKNLIIVSIILLVLLGVFLTNIIRTNSKKIGETNKNYKILTSFYPLYIMTLNITDGAKNVETSNMAEKLNGCIHDYTLNTNDLKKFEKADVFIQNGGGLENFSQKVIDSYKDIKIVSGADNISDFIIDDEGESNSHIWLSINNYISEIKTITNSLKTLNEENADIYEKNSQEYIEKLDSINSKYKSLTKLSGKKAICLNESLEYLIRDCKIEETLIETDHEQSALSAEKIKEIITKMKNENIKMIFIDKDDDSKTAQTLANETGASIYRLDSEMNGEVKKEAYLEAMNYNFDILSKIE